MKNPTRHSERLYVRYEVYGDHALYEREPHDDLAQDAEREKEIHKSDGSRLTPVFLFPALVRI